MVKCSAAALSLPRLHRFANGIVFLSIASATGILELLYHCSDVPPLSIWNFSTIVPIYLL